MAPFGTKPMALIDLYHMAFVKHFFPPTASLSPYLKDTVMSLGSHTVAQNPCVSLTELALKHVNRVKEWHKSFLAEIPQIHLSYKSCMPQKRYKNRDNER